MRAARGVRLVALAVVGVLAAAPLGGCALGSQDAPARAGASWCSGARAATAPPWTEPAGTAARPELPTTTTDRSGTEVRVTSAERILALDTYGTLASTVYALGLGDRLVGRDISTGIPALASLPLVTTDGHQLNAESILDLAPTVVLTDYSIGPLEVQLQLRDAGIPVVILDDHRSRATIGDQIRAVAHVLGVPAAGEELASRTEREVTRAERAVAARAEERGRPLRMAFLYVRGNAGVFYWFGKGSGADDLIGALGGVDVATEVGVDGYRPLTSEGLVRADPDLLLVMQDGLRSVGGVDGLVDIPGVAETTAGRRRCIASMRDSDILGFGPGYAATIEALGDAIYGSRR